MDDNAPPSFSALVGTVSTGPKGKSAVEKKKQLSLANKLKNGTVSKTNDDFKVKQSIKVFLK